MWKQSATARWLPLQAIAELCAVDAQQQEAALTGKVYLRGFDDLGRVRKMNEAVSAIDFGAAKYSRALGCTPQPDRTNFITCRHCTADLFFNDPPTTERRRNR